MSLICDAPGRIPTIFARGCRNAWAILRPPDGDTGMNLMGLLLLLENDTVAASVRRGSVMTEGNTELQIRIATGMDTVSASC